MPHSSHLGCHRNTLNSGGKKPYAHTKFKAIKMKKGNEERL